MAVGIPRLASTPGCYSAEFADNNIIPAGRDAAGRWLLSHPSHPEALGYFAGATREEGL